MKRVFYFVVLLFIFVCCKNGQNEHHNSQTNRANLHYRTIDNATGLSRTQARVIEQRLINVYGLQKYEGKLYIKINSISPRYWNRYGLINR